LLTRCVEDWKHAIDNDKFVGLLSADLSKAFDCIPHGLLVSKMHAYGVSLKSCNMIGSYLTQRRQRVKLGNIQSDWVSPTKGVPQGSILGPMLFNIFVNDMFYFIESSSLYCYADDTQIAAISNNLNDVISTLQDSGNIAVEWYKDNGMQANPKKFKCMILSRRPIDNKHVILGEDNIITVENEIRVLGITIDSRLSFVSHVSNMCRKAARQLNALARISGFIDVNFVN
jgi:hypothetical protein